MFIDGMNVYAYCGNEPFAMYDPMGLSFWSDIAATWNGMWHGAGNELGGKGASLPAMGSGQNIPSQAAAGVAERTAIAYEMAREQRGWDEAARASAASHQRFLTEGMQATAESGYGIVTNNLTGPGITGGGAAKIAGGITELGESVGSAMAGLIALVKGGDDLPGRLKGLEAVVGAYEDVKGHHILSKKAFEGDQNYSPAHALSLSEEVMKRLGIKHIERLTPIQRELYDELARSGRPNTLDEHVRIAKEALIRAGATADEAAYIVNKAEQQAKERNFTPTCIPWNRGRTSSE